LCLTGQRLIPPFPSFSCSRRPSSSELLLPSLLFIPPRFACLSPQAYLQIVHSSCFLSSLAVGCPILIFVQTLIRFFSLVLYTHFSSTQTPSSPLFLAERFIPLPVNPFFFSLSSSSCSVNFYFPLSWSGMLFPVFSSPKTHVD